MKKFKPTRVKLAGWTVWLDGRFRAQAQVFLGGKAAPAYGDVRLVPRPDGVLGYQVLFAWHAGDSAAVGELALPTGTARLGDLQLATANMLVGWFDSERSQP